MECDSGEGQNAHSTDDKTPQIPTHSDQAALVVIRRMTAAGAERFVVPTMDAKSWSARQHDQHAELFRIRACENGRWIFVVATSGVSQLIDPHGHVHARLGALQQGTISGIMKRETKLTFYTRFGWLVPWGVLGLASVLWLILLRPRKTS